MTESLLAKLGAFNRKRRNFLWFCVIFAGIPASVFGVMTAGLAVGPGFSVFVVVVVMAGVYLWGVLMWKILLGPIYERQQELMERHATHGSAEEVRKRD